MPETTTPAEPNALEKAAARQKRRQGGSVNNTEVANITEPATLGQAERLTVVEGDKETGRKPFRLCFRAPVTSKATVLYNRIMAVWPTSVLAAAISSPRGKGMDWVQIGKFLDDSERNHGNTDSTPELQQEKAENDMALFFGALTTYDLDNLATADEADEADKADEDEAVPHVLDEICGTVWDMVGGHNPGIERADLPRLLLENLRPSEFADLLRKMLRACTGCDTTYEGDVISTFTSC